MSQQNRPRRAMGRPRPERHGLRRFAAQLWQENLDAHRRLADVNRPWRTSTPLRWERSHNGWRLVGSVLPPTEQHLP